MNHRDHRLQLPQRKQMAQQVLQKRSKHPQQSDHDERNQPQHHRHVQQQLHPLKLKTSTNGRRPAAVADCRCPSPAAIADSELLRQVEHDGTQQQVVVCTIRHQSAACHHHATPAPHMPPYISVDLAPSACMQSCPCCRRHRLWGRGATEAWRCSGAILCCIACILRQI